MSLSGEAGGLSFRPASASDSRVIRALVMRAGINPRGLDWRRFLVGVDESGAIVACGQVKPHFDGSREIASIVVRTKRRGRGFGSQIVRQLMAEHAPPLWLMCRSELVGFYRRLGFAPVEDPAQMPTFFRRVYRLARLADPLFAADARLAIMAWTGEKGRAARRDTPDRGLEPPA